jgi:hypothetical protein
VLVAQALFLCDNSAKAIPSILSFWREHVASKRGPEHLTEANFEDKIQGKSVSSRTTSATSNCAANIFRLDFLIDVGFGTSAVLGKG